jgi:hypothetical protein
MKKRDVARMGVVVAFVLLLGVVGFGQEAGQKPAEARPGEAKPVFAPERCLPADTLAWSGSFLKHQFPSPL